MLCRFRAFKKLSTKELQNVVSSLLAENLCILNLFFSLIFALYLNYVCQTNVLKLWQHKVQLLLETNKMLSYLGVDARQSSVAVPLELKPFPLQFKPREIINIWLTSLFSVWTVSYGLFFSVRRNSVRYLQHCSWTRLVRGMIQRRCNFLISHKQVLYNFSHINLHFFFSSFHVSFLHHNFRNYFEGRFLVT